MIKGPPEEIIPNCNSNFLPKDIYKIISLYRSYGYINIILASKMINDFKNQEELFKFLEPFKGENPYLKIGMELFYSEGPEIVREIKKRGHKIFLDLKLYLKYINIYIYL